MIPSPSTVQPFKVSSVDSGSSGQDTKADEEHQLGHYKAQEASGHRVNVESSLSLSLEQPLLINSESMDAQLALSDTSSNGTETVDISEGDKSIVQLEVNEEDKSKDLVGDVNMEHTSFEEQTEQTESSEPVSKKRSVHITSLAVLSVPDKDVSVAVSSVFKASSGTSKDSPQSTTVLITGITVWRDGNFVPLLVVHRVKLTKSKQKKQGPKKKVPMPPVDYPLEELFELPPEPSSLDDPLYSAPWEAPIEPNSEVTDFPATLQYVQSFVLSEHSVFGHSGGQPEIQQIVPLDSGRLLAVTCNMTKNPPGFFGGKKEKECAGQTSPALSGSLFLFTVDGVVINFLQSLPIYDPSRNIVSMCSVEENQTSPSQNEEPSPKNKREQSVLLATLLGNGEVVLYDCSKSQLTPVVTFDPSSSEPCLDSLGSSTEAVEEFVDCAYCPITDHLALATRRGKIVMLKLDRPQNEESGSCEDVVDGRQERKSVSDEECFKHSESLHCTVH